MKTIILSTGEWVLVKVPDDTVDVYVADPRYLSFRKSKGERVHVQYIGNYQVVGRASELSEEKWKGILSRLTKVLPNLR